MWNEFSFVKKITSLAAAPFWVISSALYSLPLHTYAAELSPVTDQLSPEEQKYFYENFPEIIQGIASADSDSGASIYAMATEYSIVPQISQNPAFYLYPGQTVEFPIIYGIPGSTPVTPSATQYMYFQLQINLPSIPGVTLYVDKAYANYNGTDYPTSYTFASNYYFLIPPGPTISDTNGGLLSFVFRIKAVYNGTSSKTITSTTGNTVHNQSTVQNFSISNNLTSTKSTLNIDGKLSSGFITGSVSGAGVYYSAKYFSSGQLNKLEQVGSHSISISPHSYSFSNASIANPMYGLVWSVPSFNFLLGREDHALTSVSNQSGTYVPPTTFNVISRVQWFPIGKVNDVLSAIKENTAAVKDTTAWVKENYTQVVRTNDILSQTNNLQSEANMLQQTNNQQQLQQTQTIKDQTTTITNQTNEMMNGFDNSSMGSSNEKLSGSIAEYDTAEDAITSSAVASMSNFVFDDYFAFAAGTSSAMSFVGSFITSCGGASGDFFSVVMIGLCMMFISILVGLWRFRGG